MSFDFGNIELYEELYPDILFSQSIPIAEFRSLENFLSKKKVIILTHLIPYFKKYNLEKGIELMGWKKVFFLINEIIEPLIDNDKQTIIRGSTIKKNWLKMKYYNKFYD